MKTSEIKDKGVGELNKELEDLLREGFNLRMQMGSGQMTQTHQLRQNRRDIARVKTVLNQKASS